MRKTLALVAAAILAMLAMTGCTSMSTDSDEAGLVYNAGALSDTQFDVCVPPGNKEWDGPQDKHISYPAGQRTLRFDADKGADRGMFTVNTKDPIELKVSGVITFELKVPRSKDDPACKVFQAFHESIGNKYKNTIDNGETTQRWIDFLNDYVAPSTQRALSDATQNLGWAPLYSDGKAKTDWEKSVLTTLPTYIKQAMGGDFITIKSVTIQKPDLPDDLANAIRATQVAIQENKAQGEKNAKINTELDSIRALVKVLGPEGYNTYKAIESGKISVMPIPQGSSVVIPQGAAK